MDSHFENGLARKVTLIDYVSFAAVLAVVAMMCIALVAFAGQIRQVVSASSGDSQKTSDNKSSGQSDSAVDASEAANRSIVDQESNPLNAAESASPSLSPPQSVETEKSESTAAQSGFAAEGAKTVRRDHGLLARARVLGSHKPKVNLYRSVPRSVKGLISLWRRALEARRPVRNGSSAVASKTPGKG